MTTTYNLNTTRIQVGWVPNGLSISAITSAMNAAANWFAFCFTAEATGLSSFMFDISAITGTVVAADITGQVYTNGAGIPGTAVGSAGVLSANPTTGWNTITGITSGTLTVGESYWFVFKNGNATPTSNYITLRCNPGINQAYGAGNFIGPRNAVSTNSGSTWAIGAATNTWRAYDSASDTYWGFPASTAVVVSSGERVQAATEIGVQFVTPAGVSLNTKSLSLMPYRLGTAIGNIGLKLYDSGMTLLATSLKKPYTDIDTGSPRGTLFRFSSTITLTANTTYYAMMFEDGSSSGSNYYQMFKVPFETSSASTALRPLSTKLYKNVSGTFSEITGYITPMAILLSSGNEFSVSAGGGPVSYMFSG